MWHPTEEELEEHARRLLERAYANRGRARCGREDFSEGYLAALRDLRSRSSFKAGAYREEA